MKLPILVSVPHAGLRIPPEVETYCQLSHEEIVADGDEGAAEIYAIQDEAAAFVTTDVARAIVDMNRVEDDRRPDGVVKTHTCWDVPVYNPFPPSHVVDRLLSAYYRPYHRLLTKNAAGNIRCGIDCHTMAAVGPPIGPDAGRKRPSVCLSDGNGTTFPTSWMRQLVMSFSKVFECDIAMNKPFRGGYITRSHSNEMPWIQLELSRCPFLTTAEKRRCVIASLTDFCSQDLPEPDRPPIAVLGPD